MKYRVRLPFIDDMGSVSPIMASDSLMETAEENALWTLNSMRDHDGLPRLKELPKGTNLDPIPDQP